MVVVNAILNAIVFLLIIRVFISIFAISPRQNMIVQKIFEWTDVFLKPLQKIIPIVEVGNYTLDFSPLVIILLIDLIQKFLRTSF